MLKRVEQKERFRQRVIEARVNSEVLNDAQTDGRPLLLLWP